MSRPTKEQVRKIRCPRCLADSHQPCKRKGSTQGETVFLYDRHHKERIRAAKERAR